MSTRAAAAASAVAVLIAAPAAGAGPVRNAVALPDPSVRLSATPPLADPVGGENEVVAPRAGVTASTRVTIGVGPSGRVVSVRARQRLLVLGSGDYQLLVPGPFRAAEAAPGSAAEPGLRRNGLLWAGFSSGRRVLAADAVLDVRAVERELPVAVEITTVGGVTTIALRNRTSTTARAYTGRPDPAGLAALLDEMRVAVPAGKPLEQATATLLGSFRLRQWRAEAPLRVTGTLVLPRAPRAVSGPAALDGRRVRVDAVLGDGGPLAAIIRVRGGGQPTLRLRVTPVAPLRLLRPPGAATWRAAAAQRRVTPAKLLDRAVGVRLRLARAAQFRVFLANPAPAGTSTTTYALVSGTPDKLPRAGAVVGRDTGAGGGPGGAAIVAGLLAALALTAAGTAWWARA